MLITPGLISVCCLPSIDYDDNYSLHTILCHPGEYLAEWYTLHHYVFQDPTLNGAETPALQFN